ncbi:hypothetical protein ACOME3_004192 [Neoechinorhynchus agilis]
MVANSMLLTASVPTNVASQRRHFPSRGGDLRPSSRQRMTGSRMLSALTVFSSRAKAIRRDHGVPMVPRSGMCTSVPQVSGTLQSLLSRRREGYPQKRMG